MLRCEIRGAVRADEEDLLTLARHLNSVNLPHDRPHVQKLLDHSERSFTGDIKDPRKRKFVFLLRDLETGSAVGTSMIVAQLGRRDAPYIFFDVITEEKYHADLDRHFQHTVLHLGFSYQGPTELGGLVVLPEHRRALDRYGLLISYVRFLFIAVHRELFQNDLLAELLPPLEADGTSHLWEALGRRFTGMSYGEADLLSSSDKSFIRDLFPNGSIYASLLSTDAQNVIGKVGAQTKGVEKMLRRIGFRYAERIDPFDGGPHFLAAADDVTLIRNARVVRIGQAAGVRPAARCLVARDLTDAPYFRAVPCDVQTLDENHVAVASEVQAHLGLAQNDDAYVLPLS
jgi:arginine N-succinyltransferase